MMTLDCSRRPLERYRFDHVRIERSLAEKTRAADRRRLALEDVDKSMSDNAPLLLGIQYSRQTVEKQSRCVSNFQFNSQVACKGLLHAFALTETQKSVVDE